MAKTPLVATYARPDNRPDRGKVEFLLVPANYQDFETAIVTSPVVVTLSTSGGLSVQLLPTSGDDADWDDDVLYKVTERIRKTRVRSYFVDVPTSSAPLRLGDLVGYVAPPPDPSTVAIPSSTTYPSSSLFPG